MIGTDKKQIGATELLPELETVINLIQADNLIDKTEQFIRIAAIAANYRKCGALPLHVDGLTINTAAKEEKLDCSDAAYLVLREILDIGSTPLLFFWLEHCQANNTIVPPEITPTILDIATKQKKLQAVAAACCGKCGEWLGSFNNSWNYCTMGTDEELWETGVQEQRKEVLARLRKTDISQARLLLQESWSQEDANSKNDFLKILHATVNADDIVFLEYVQNEKSKKVKDEAIVLLKEISTSKIVLQYWGVAEKAVQLRVEKGMLGLTTKKKITIEMPKDFNQEIFKTGVDKLSNNKLFTDDEFIVYQLLQYVPLQNWELHLNSTPEEIIRFFQKDKMLNKFLAAFVLSAVNFKDERWAILLMQILTIFYIDLIPLLPIQQQDYYSNKNFVGNENAIIQLALKSNVEWSLELAKNIISYTAKNPYNYYRNFYNENIRLIPINIAKQLAQCTPQEPQLQHQWNNTMDYILKLVYLKEKTIVSNSNKN